MQVEEYSLRLRRIVAMQRLEKLSELRWRRELRH